MENILQCFPSSIVTSTIEKNTDVLKKETNFVNSNYQEDTGNNDFRILKKYPKVKKILLEKFKKVAREKLGYSNDFAISTSWITKIETGGEVQQHCHKNSFYSGIYYYDEYEQNKGGKLELQSPLINLRDFYLIPKDWNHSNSNVIEISPIKNLLVLFPSYLFHRVLTYHGTITRRSLAFNIVPTGSYGHGDSSYNTSW